MNNNEIQINKTAYKDLTINFDRVEFGMIVLIIDGKEYIFPEWEFRQVLQNYHDMGKKFI